MNRRFILFLILFLAAILRFFNVSRFPVSLYWDEVAIGYNGYSISKTGSDEYGKFLPITFESFQDSKLPGYIYLTAVNEMIFGVNAFAVRFTSVVSGIFSVYLVYLIAKRLFNDSTHIPHIASFFMAISPWALQFSRVGFEANSALTISLLGIYFYLKYVFEGKYFYPAVISIALSFYFYYQEWIFFPAFIIISSILIKDKIVLTFKKIIIGIIISVVLLTPLIYAFFLSGSETRLSHVENIFTNSEIIKDSVEARANEDNPFIGTLVYNRHLVKTLAFLKAYFEHFSTKYLFFDGDPNPRHSPTGIGMMYLWAIPFIVLGFVYIISKFKTTAVIIVVWLISAPISASLSTPVPHALRSLLMLPVLELISAAGLSWVILEVKEKVKFPLYSLIIIIFVSLVAYFQFYYLHYYYVNASRDSLSWADGYSDLYQYISTVENKYEKIYVTGKYWRPYIFMLFYNQYPPSEYWVNGTHNGIGKYLFGYASYDTSDPHYVYNTYSIPDLKKEKGNLIALAPEEVSAEDRIIKTIYSVLGKPVFLIVESGPEE